MWLLKQIGPFNLLDNEFYQKKFYILVVSAEDSDIVYVTSLSLRNI